MNEEKRTSEERIFAAVSHGAAILMGWGTVVPLVVWITQREKSRYVKFHALQAMAFQLTQSLFSMAIFTVLSIAIIVMMFAAAFSNAGSFDIRSPVIIQMVSMGAALLIMAVYPMIGLIAAILTFTGRDFRYPILGTWLKNYLLQEIEAKVTEDVENE